MSPHSFNKAASVVVLLLSTNLNQDVTAFLVPNPVSVRKSSVTSFSFPNAGSDFNKKSSSGKTFILRKKQQELQDTRKKIGYANGRTKSSITTKINSSPTTKINSSPSTNIYAKNSFFSKSNDGDKKNGKSGKNTKSPKKTASSPTFGNLFQSSEPKNGQTSPKAKSNINKKKNEGKNSKSPKKTASSPTFGNLFQSSEPKNEQTSPKAKSNINKKTNEGKSTKSPKKTASSPTFGNLFQSSEPKKDTVKVSTAPKSTSTPTTPSVGNFFLSPKPSGAEAEVRSVPEKEKKVEASAPTRPKTPIEKLNAANSGKATQKLEPSMVSNFFDKIKNPVGTSKSKDEKVKLKPGEEIITNDITGFTTTILTTRKELEDLPEVDSSEPKGKFTFAQRIESVKAGIVGLVAGGVALTPIAAFHDILFPGDSIANGVAQWEFDTDTGSITTALFAIVYRYCIRDGEERNEMLQMGVIGAFVLVRTLARIRVPVYCTAAPLDCGDPFGYFDSSMIQQAIGSGLESIVMFGATALALEYCYENGYISRFK